MPAGLVLGGAYLIKVEFRNRAGLTATAYSETLIADWTLPEVTTPLLSSGPRHDDAVVPGNTFPSGGSTWGGIRAFSWVGKNVQMLTVTHDETYCLDTGALPLP